MKIYARQLKHEDKERASFLVSLVYHTRFEDLEKRKANWDDEGSEMWGAFVEDKLASVFYNNHFECIFDDQRLDINGVGGVASLPEYRHSGCVKEAFREFLKASYDRDNIISCLYPFSFYFYRKFGYEMVPCKNGFTLNVKTLSDYSFDGTITMFEEGMDAKPYNDLYNNFIKNYNFMIPRSIESWQYRLPRNVFKEQRYAYLLSKNDENIAYVILKNANGRLDVNEAVWASRDGFNAILGFLSRFSADYETISLSLPPNIDLKKIIHSRDISSLEVKPRYGFMVRIVNVMKALEFMKKPENASFTIQVYDDFLKENNNTYKVENGKVSITDEAPDVKCSVQSFAQLYTGALSIDELELKDDFDLYKNKEQFRIAFNKKPVFINMYF